VPEQQTAVPIRNTCFVHKSPSAVWMMNWKKGNVVGAYYLHEHDVKISRVSLSDNYLFVYHNLSSITTIQNYLLYHHHLIIIITHSTGKR